MDVSKFPADAVADIERLVGPVDRDGEIMRNYSVHDGASSFDRMLQGWNPSYGSADADIIPEKMDLDVRARDVRRNDGYVQSAENQHRDTVVGSRYALNLKPETSALISGGDDKWEEEFQEEVETKFMLAADSPDNWLDASGALDFTGQVRLAMGVAMATNEIIATAEWDKDTARPFKTCVQLVESDRLQTPMEYGMDENVRGGVRIDRFGRPLGVYIRQHHPGDFWSGWLPNDFKYVPMRKPWGRSQAIFLRDPRRPGQQRCVADLVAGLKEVRTTHRFRDIMLENAIVNGMYAASIESELPSDVIAAQLGGGSANAGEIAAKYAMSYMSAVSAYAGKAKGIKLDGVKIPHLFPGTKLNMMPAGTPGGIGSEFELGLLRYLAATLGLSYEEFSRDYSKTNYSSIKAAINTTARYQRARKKLFADAYANAIFRLWFEEQMNAGNIEAMKYSKLPNYYDGLNREAFTKSEWIGADFGQIDELKETQASVLRLNNNLSTHELEFGRRGLDWRKMFRQKAKEKKLQEELGIEIQDQNSNMMNAAQGSGRQVDDEGSSDASN